MKFQFHAFTSVVTTVCCRSPLIVCSQSSHRLKFLVDCVAVAYASSSWPVVTLQAAGNNHFAITCEC